MKKKTKNLLLLVGLFAVLVAGYFALDLLPEDTVEEDTVVDETVVIADFSEADITYYCYSNEEYEMGFTVTEDGYTHYKDSTFPVNTASVQAQLSALASLTALQVIESTDKAEYGLDVPKKTVALTLADGTEHTYFIGDSALFEDADYLLDVENDVIYLVESGFSAEFAVSWSSMVQQEEKITLTSDQITDVTVETAGEQTMVISYDESKEQPWQLTTPEGTFDGDSDAVTTALGAFGSYSLMETFEYNCTDLAKYGLEEPATTVTVRYTEPEGTESKTLVFEFGAVNEDSVSYVRINGSSYVYGMSEYYTESVSVFNTEELKYQPEGAAVTEE